MKKNVLRIFATAAAVIALALVIVLLVATFGGIEVEDFNNSLVRGLLTTMSIAFVLLTAVTLAMLFISDEITKEIALRTGSDGNTRITVGVIKKIAKENCALIPGVKCKKCVIVTNEYGVRLKLTVSIKEKDVEEAENEIRALLSDAYYNVLGFKFHSIEIRVKKLVPAYKADVAKILEDADEKTAENKAKAEAENKETVDEQPKVEPVREEEPDGPSDEEAVPEEEPAAEEAEVADPAPEMPAEEKDAEDVPSEEIESEIAEQSAPMYEDPGMPEDEE